MLGRAGLLRGKFQRRPLLEREGSQRRLGLVSTYEQSETSPVTGACTLVEVVLKEPIGWLAPVCSLPGPSGDASPRSRASLL